MEMLQKDFIDVEAKTFMHTYGIPGMVVGMKEHGRTVYAGGFGYRDIQESLPATMDTVFGIASLTKSFTCIAIMSLQEQGKLTVDDAVIKYLPEFRTPDPQVTGQIRIHHLMTHTSGIPPLPTIVYAMKRSAEQDPSVSDYGAIDMTMQQYGPIDTYEQLMAFMADFEYELLGPPGTQFSYSNDCYGLLSAIVERASGKKYENYVEEMILQPSGMEHSSFHLDKLLRHREVTTLYAATMENGRKITYPAPIWWEAPSMLGTGYLRSTANDMLKYMDIFLNGGKVGNERIISSESVAMMMMPHIQKSPSLYYGYGVHLSTTPSGEKFVEHGGGLKGISSRMCMIPEKGLSGIVLSNLAECPVSSVMYKALDVVQGNGLQSRRIAWEPYDLRREEMDDFTGGYTCAEGIQLRIELSAGNLWYVARNSKVMMRPVYGPDLFLVATADEEIVFRFFRNTEGEVARVWVSSSSRQLYKENG